MTNDPERSEDTAAESDAERPVADEAASASATTEEPKADEAANAAEAPQAEVEVEAETKAEPEAEPVVEAAEVVMEAATEEVAKSDEKSDSDDAAKTAAAVTESIENDDRLKNEMKKGQRVEVKLVQVGDKEAFLDFGGQSEGTIAAAELRNDKGELRVKEGETFTAIVKATGDTVEFTVGRGKGGDMLRLRELESAMEAKIPIPGKVKSANKGGFEVDVQGARAFCPFSQIDTVYCDDPNVHLGQTYSFLVIAFERGGRNIVLSRRTIIEEESREAAKGTRENLALGAQFEGTVRRIQPYGAFVDIGGIDGLVHVSELSRGHVGHPKDVVKVGERVKVQVVGIDNLGEKKERISLSMKVLEADPWEGAAEKWPVASKVTGRVVRLTDFGAFVELSKGIDGLIHVSEISTERIGHPNEVLTVNQEVEVRILSIDADSRRISLTMRPEGEERPARRNFDRDGEEGGRHGGGRPRRDREYGGNRELTSYTSKPEEKKDEVDVSGMEYDDALEILKRKFKE